MHQRRILELLWILCGGSVLATLVSGAMIALVYHPSSQAVSGGLYRAETAITDAVGDTLLRQGEWIVLDSLPHSYRGMLRLVGDSTVRWSRALLSHAELVAQPAGALLIAVHQVAATVLVCALAGIAVMEILLGYHWRSHHAAWIVLLVAALTTSWLGTTLAADPRGVAAYDVGRALLTDNIPALGDILALLLPATADVARRFALHAIWLGAMVVLLLVSLKPESVRAWSSGVGLSASAIVALGCIGGALSPPAMLHTETAPIWHLGIVFELLHHLPMDATMLIVLLWWGGAFAAGLSKHRLVRTLGAALVAVWFGSGAVLSIVRQ